MRDARSVGRVTGTATHTFLLYVPNNSSITSLVWVLQEYNAFVMFLKALRIVSKPVSVKFFFFVLILNLLSNYVELWWDTTLFAYVGIFLLSALTAYIESVIYLILNKQWLKIVYAIIVALIHNMLIVCEYFLLTQFQKILNQDVIDILAETNTVETENFLQTYVSPLLVVSVLLLISA